MVSSVDYDCCHPSVCMQFASDLHGVERGLTFTPPTITPLTSQARFEAILVV